MTPLLAIGVAVTIWQTYAGSRGQHADFAKSKDTSNVYAGPNREITRSGQSLIPNHIKLIGDQTEETKPDSTSDAYGQLL